MKNITLVSLNDNFGKLVAEKFAKEINYYFADAKAILSYNFVDDDVIKACGVDYFLDLKESTMQEVSHYENTVTYMSASMFLSIQDKDNFLKNTALVYLYLSMDKFMLSLYNDKKLTQSEREVEILQYDDRDAMLKKYATYTVPSKTLGTTSVIKCLAETLNLGVKDE